MLLEAIFTALAGASVGGYFLYREDKSIVYGYLNTRLSHRLNRLIPKDFFEKTTEESYDESIKNLRETEAYKDIPSETNELDRYLSKRFIEEVNATILLLPRDYQRIVREVVMLRVEIENIKTAIANSMSDVKILPEFNAAYELTREKLDAIPRLNSFDDFLKMIRGTRYEALFAEATPQSIAEMEMMLEKYYFKKVVAELDKADSKSKKIREYISKWIDVKNLWLLRHCVENGLDFTRYYIPLGTLSLEMLTAAGKRIKPEERVNELWDSVYGGVFSYALSKNADVYWERSLSFIMDDALEAVKSDYFGPAYSLYYLLAREKETRRIKMMLISKHLGLKPKEVVIDENSIFW